MKPNSRQRPTYLYLRRAACPSCGDRLLAYRSVRDQGDGSSVRWCRCAGCGGRVVCVWEDPYQNLEGGLSPSGTIKASRGPTMNVISLAFAAAKYQTDPASFRAGLTVVQAEPRLTLNQVAYYDVGDVERAAAWIKRTEQECLTR